MLGTKIPKSQTEGSKPTKIPESQSEEKNTEVSKCSSLNPWIPNRANSYVCLIISSKIPESQTEKKLLKLVKLLKSLI